MATWAVWYSAAGCIPDTDEPEFIGTVEECAAWITQNSHEYERPDVEFDTYSLSISELEFDYYDLNSMAAGDRLYPYPV